MTEGLKKAKQLVITSTGFSSIEKLVLQEKVEHLGATYSGDLQQHVTTHLLCNNLLDAFNTPKYVKALEWGIPAISYRWIYDSLAVGYLLPVDSYKSDPIAFDDVLKGETEARRQQGTLPARKPLAPLDNIEQQKLRQPSKSLDQLSPAKCKQGQLAVHGRSLHSAAYHGTQEQKPAWQNTPASNPSIAAQETLHCSQQVEIPQPQVTPQPTLPVTLNSLTSASMSAQQTVSGVPSTAKQTATCSPDRTASQPPQNMRGSESTKQAPQPSTSLNSFQFAAPSKCIGQTAILDSDPDTPKLLAQEPEQASGLGVQLHNQPPNVVVQDMRSLSRIMPEPDVSCGLHSMQDRELIIPASPGTDYDDIIIPGTQVMDEDEEMGTPQSLLEYLRNKRSSSVTAQSSAVPSQHLVGLGAVNGNTAPSLRAPIPCSPVSSYGESSPAKGTSMLEHSTYDSEVIEGSPMAVSPAPSLSFRAISLLSIPCINSTPAPKPSPMAISTAKLTPLSVSSNSQLSAMSVSHNTTETSVSALQPTRLDLSMLDTNDTVPVISILQPDNSGQHVQGAEGGCVDQQDQEAYKASISLSTSTAPILLSQCALHPAAAAIKQAIAAGSMTATAITPPSMAAASSANNTLNSLVTAHSACTVLTNKQSAKLAAADARPGVCKPNPAGVCAADAMEMSPAPPHRSSVLYSGFATGLGDIATATKTRRLVRNDMLLSPVHASQANTEPEKLLLDDQMDLEDDLTEPDEPDQTFGCNQDVHLRSMLHVDGGASEDSDVAGPLVQLPQAVEMKHDSSATQVQAQTRPLAIGQHNNQQLQAALHLVKQPATSYNSQCSVSQYKAALASAATAESTETSKRPALRPSTSNMSTSSKEMLALWKQREQQQMRQQQATSRFQPQSAALSQAKDEPQPVATVPQAQWGSSPAQPRTNDAQVPRSKQQQQTSVVAQVSGSTHGALQRADVPKHSSQRADPQVFHSSQQRIPAQESTQVRQASCEAYEGKDGELAQPPPQHQLGEQVDSGPAPNTGDLLPASPEDAITNTQLEEFLQPKQPPKQMYANGNIAAPSNSKQVPTISNKQLPDAVQLPCAPGLGPGKAGALGQPSCLSSRPSLSSLNAAQLLKPRFPPGTQVARKQGKHETEDKPTASMSAGIEYVTVRKAGKSDAAAERPHPYANIKIKREPGFQSDPSNPTIPARNHNALTSTTRLPQRTALTADPPPYHTQQQDPEALPGRHTNAAPRVPHIKPDPEGVMPTGMIPDNELTPEPEERSERIGPVAGSQTIARTLGGVAQDRGLTPLNPAMAVAVTPLTGDALDGFDDDSTGEDDDFVAAAPTTCGDISKYMLQSIKAAAPLSDADILLVKPMGRPSRGHTVRERHPSVAIKDVQFVEQVQIDSLQLLLNCRDRSRRSRCPILAIKHPVTHQSTGCLAEPFAIYRLPSGDWWMEYYPFYTRSDIQSLATTHHRTLHLPVDFHRSYELLRDTDRQHCRLTAVRGDLGVTRTKKLPSKFGRGERPAFCRFVFDSKLMVVMTDEPASDFVLG